MEQKKEKMEMRHLMKKDRKMEKKREKMEKYYMGKEDVKVLAGSFFLK